MTNEEKVLENMNGLKGNLEELMRKSSELQKFTQDLLPSDKFTADMDGVDIEVSMAMNGRAIVFSIVNQDECRRIFNEMKQNRKGFFKRIFNTR